MDNLLTYVETMSFRLPLYFFFGVFKDILHCIKIYSLLLSQICHYFVFQTFWIQCLIQSLRLKKCFRAFIILALTFKSLIHLEFGGVGNK